MCLLRIKRLERVIQLVEVKEITVSTLVTNQQGTNMCGIYISATRIGLENIVPSTDIWLTRLSELTNYDDEDYFFPPFFALLFFCSRSSSSSNC